MTDTSKQTAWHPIETIPQVGRVDVWAKRWDAKSDAFEHRRFVDCFWRGTHVAGVKAGWRAVYWTPIPTAPEGADDWQAKNAA